MDFFSAPHAVPPPPAVSSSADPFAQEIGRRFSLPHTLLTARLDPAAPAPAGALRSLSLSSKPTSPAPAPAPAPAPPHPDAPLAPVLPAALPAVLAAPDLLVLDIRPHGTFALSRLPHALSLSVPSTLLKRPAFSLAKLSEMLPSPAARRHFAAWPAARRILVYDADSHVLTDAGNIRGLLRKFHNEGFRGDLLWLKGGFAAVWQHARALVDDGPPDPDASDDDDDSCSPSSYLCAKNLPLSAFQQVSTTTASQRPALRPAPLQPRHHVAPAPTFTKPVPANPFYDNIRQFRELQHGITERIPLRLPDAVLARRDDLPFAWLKDIVDKADAEEGTEALAMQFYMIELREQRRLMGVMDHHSRQAAAPALVPAAFPYSITAAVEKGSKNRYANIWPFEHARVRLGSRNLDDGSDYINASHVQPLGTDRRYIATQGPLPTTYTDFWTLCWEQRIRIIVMLTKEVEGTTVKCGTYWTESTYGPFRLHLVSSSSRAELEHLSPPGFDFGLPAPGPPLDPDDAIIRRTFLVSHTEHPEEPPRRITQLQYLAWSDFDVPEDPQGLLSLMGEVDELREEAEGEDTVLLHCSAGIGRTGGFIVADAALDGIRREMLQRRGRVDAPSPRCGAVRTASPAAMDMDGSDAGASPRLHLRALAPLQHVRDISPLPARRRPRHRCSSGTDTSGGGAPSDDSLLSTTPSSSLEAPRCAAEAPRKRAAPSSASATPTLLPSVFSASAAARSTVPSSFPVSVESSRAPSPAKDAEPPQAPAPRAPPPPAAEAPAFDYTDPRALHGAARPAALSQFAEPVRKMLEDMREQRMSLCQSLRQYVFVHRAVVEGALALVDAERAAAARGARGKRGPSPTELRMEDRTGAVRLSKRPSVKRRARSAGGSPVR